LTAAYSNRFVSTTNISQNAPSPGRARRDPLHLLLPCLRERREVGVASLLARCVPDPDPVEAGRRPMMRASGPSPRRAPSAASSPDHRAPGSSSQYDNSYATDEKMSKGYFQAMERAGASDGGTLTPFTSSHRIKISSPIAPRASNEAMRARSGARTRTKSA